MKNRVRIKFHSPRQEHFKLSCILFNSIASDVQERERIRYWLDAYQTATSRITTNRMESATRRIGSIKPRRIDFKWQHHKTAFQILQRTLSTYFSEQSNGSQFKIQLQTILILRAKTRNNHLAEVCPGTWSGLFLQPLDTQVKGQAPKICDYKQKSGKHSLFECIRAQIAVIKNFQFKARSWTVSQLLKEYGEEFLLTPKRGHLKTCSSKISKGMTCISPTQADLQTTFRFPGHFAPIIASVLSEQQQTPRYLTSINCLWVTIGARHLPQRLSGDCNLFFQIEGEKMDLIDPNFTLMIYPVIPPEPPTGKAWLINTT